MNLSNYLRNALISGTVRGVTFTAPSTVYIALYTSDPTVNDVGTEVSGGSYARVAATFSVPSGGASQNSALISFPQATLNWGTITHIGIRDASSGGNLLWFGALSAARIVNNGGIFQIQAGALTLQLS